MKRFLARTLPALLMLGLLAGCAGNSGEAEPGATEITLSDGGIQINGGGAKADGRLVTIGAVGTYSVSGSLSDGQIVIDTGDEAVDVTLLLNGVDITNLSGPAIHIRQAKNARIELAAGTKNGVTSGAGPDMDLSSSDASGAAIYAEDDLDIEGEGELIVCGYINNGIACKDDLDINSGSISVYAANNGIRGSKSVEIKGGSIAVNAGNDGIKSTAANKEGKGFVRIRGGEIFVTAGGDGISAETELSIEEGAVVAVTAMGDPDQVSSKALKAQTGLAINGGILTLSSADHTIRSAAGLTITGGNLTAESTGGKAIAAHGDISITGGELYLIAAGDGVETTGDIRISGGMLFLTTGDDGFQAGEADSGAGDVTVDGGETVIQAKGQTINARGELALNGGVLLALGGSSKAPAPTGSLPVLNIAWSGAGGRVLSVADQAGTDLASATTVWPVKRILLTSPSLAEGVDFTVSDGVNSVTAKASR